MKKLFFKIFGLVIIVGGFLISTYFIFNRIINESSYILVVLGSIIVGFLIYKIEDIVEFKTKWIELKILQREVYAKVEEVKRISEEVEATKNALKESSRVFIESFYLSLQTRNIFPIPEGVAKKIEQNLNILANFAIEDPQKRQRGVSEINQLLHQNLPK
jgi:hypothetical protein